MRKQNLFELTSEVKSIINELPIIVGSQAIFAITEYPPEIVRKSVECDYLLLKEFAKLRPNLTEKLGIFSQYQQETGFYADILGLATVVLPVGWEKRLVELKNENGEKIALCVEIHDVAVSKLMAGREKDFEFLQSAFLSDYLETEILFERLRLIWDSPFSEALLSRLQKLTKKIGKETSLRGICNELRNFEREIKNK